MTLEATVTDLVNATTALHDAVRDKKTVLDNAAQQAAASLTATQSKQAEATASAAAAAASAATATNQTAEITAFKNAASALNTSTTATQAVTNLLPDMLAKKDPARHPFRNKLPSLVLDFERQKAHRYSDSTGFAETPLASLMTFTRNSTATYTGPDGVLRTAAVNQPRYDYDPITGEGKGLLIEEQRTNLLTYSSDFLGWFAGGATVNANVSTSPNGTLTATKLIAASTTGYHLIQKPYYLVATGKTFTVYAKKCEYTGVLLSASNNPFPANEVVVSLVDGSVISTGTMVSGVVVTPFADGWFRISVQYSSLEDTGWNIGVCDGSSRSFTGNNTSGIYIWGAQLEAGSFPTSYIPTPATFTGRASTATYLDANGVVQTAGVGVARSAAYDYDADGVLRPIGLLLEASATNLLLHSSDYTNAVWTKNFGGVGTTPVVTSAYGTAPDGTTTAQRVQLALNGGGSIDDYASISQSVTTVAGNTYTESVWLKTADASTKVVQLSFNGDVTQLLTVTGTWKRFSITGTALDTNRGFRLELRGTTGTSDSADLLMWGAQHGLGNYATSYIPTTTAQVTRAADSSTSAQATRVADDASVTSGFVLNHSAGTLFASASSVKHMYGYLAQLDNGTEWERLALCRDKPGGVDGVLAINCTNGAAITVKQNADLTVSSAVRTGISYNLLSSSAALQGASVGLTNISRPRRPATRVLIGRSANLGIFCNGYIRRITYYPTAFTNEELQVLTSA